MAISLKQRDGQDNIEHILNKKFKNEIERRGEATQNIYLKFFFFKFSRKKR